jgi:nitrate reductase gamma subunit
MDTWIELARGPLFRIALAVCVVGLAFRLGVTVTQIVVSWRRAGDRRVPIRDVAVATVQWLFPVRLLHLRPVSGMASLLFHLGVVVVPLFLAGHVALLQGVLPAWWPTLPAAWADGIVILALVGIATLLVARAAVASARRLTRPADSLVLVVLLAMLLFGFLAAHPGLSPVAARAMVLLHILLGDLVLVMIPLTKIAHCVLYPLTQLVFQLGWHFPAESGRHVAVALAKENEPV